MRCNVRGAFVFWAAWACALLVVPLARADYRIQFSDSYGDDGGGGHGGEFLISQVAGHEFDFSPGSLPADLGGVLSAFETFCLERNEYLRFGTTYRVELSTEAIHGGLGNDGPLGPTGGDLLSPETAYLYSQFITGNLDGYEYSTTRRHRGRHRELDRIESANALQNTIWYLEDELSDINLGLNRYERSLAAMYLDDALLNAGSGIGNVWVMNVFGLDGTYRQDQLVTIPQPIPAPGAAILGAIGLIFAGYFRRRFR